MTVENSARGERTREDIVTAAHQLFLEQGFHGTSMRQIAHKAHIAVGGIYNHFSSKEEIFLAVLLHFHPFFDLLPAMNAAQGETVDEFVRDAARRIVGELGEGMEFLNLLFIELVEFKGRHVPQVFELIFPQVMEFAHRFLEGKDKLKPIPRPIIVRAFIGLFFSYVMTEMIIGKQLPPEMRENSLDHFVDIYLYGILDQ